MSSPTRARWSWFAVCIVVVLLAWFLGAPEALQKCVSEKPYPPTHKQDQSNFAIDRLSLRANAGCLFGFAEDHDGWILMAATVALAIYTLKLWRATNTLATNASRDATRQAELTREAILLSEKEFIASNPPKLAVRRIYFHDPQGDGGPATPSGIYFTVQNRGDAPATITAIYTTHRIHPKGLRLPPWVTPLTKELITKVLPAGGQSQEFYPMEDLQRRRVISNYQAMMDRSEFYFVGEISFEDANRVERRMAFCRKYDLSTKRFERQDDADYEYGD